MVKPATGLNGIGAVRLGWSPSQLEARAGRKSISRWFGMSLA